MKFQLYENEGCYSLQVDAETLPDAALLVRLGADAKLELNYLSTDVFTSGEFRLHVVFGKNKDSQARLPRRHGGKS